MTNTSCAPKPTTGSLWGVGVGPGDPDLVTVAAVKAIGQADVIAYHSARPGSSIAKKIAGQHFPPDVLEVEFVYPVTTGTTTHRDGYRGALNDFYTECANTLRSHLDAGKNVVIVSEGDPSTYSSYQHHHRRLSPHYRTTVVPGITSYSAAAAAAGEPLVEDTQVLSIIPATLPNAELLQHLDRCDAAVVMKLSRNAATVQQSLADVNKLDRSVYVERVGHDSQQVAAYSAIEPNNVPYMSLVVCPGPLPSYYETAGPVEGEITGSATTVEHVASDRAGCAGVSGAEASSLQCGEAIDSASGSDGYIVVLGLGPGPDDWVTPATTTALAEVTDVIGYAPYVNRVPTRVGLVKHASPNRVEAERVALAIRLARQGRKVAVVSGGDPGVFAMAAAVLEEADLAGARDVDIRVEPGVTAATAAAARLGAPLGHDFALISLSDQLKPWKVVEDRLVAAFTHDVAVGLYNPASRTRRDAINATADLMRSHHGPGVPVAIARNVGRPGESFEITTVAEFDPDVVDMSSLVIVGSSKTRVFHSQVRDFLYTPRSYSQ